MGRHLIAHCFVNISLACSGRGYARLLITNQPVPQTIITWDNRKIERKHATQKTKTIRKSKVPSAPFLSYFTRGLCSE